MIKKIPEKANHTIKGFNEIKPVNDDLPILYEPIYERVFPLNTVHWDYYRSERIYLISDTQGITCEGQFVEVNPKCLGLLDQADKKMFFELLAHNGYEIKDGNLTIHPEIGKVYISSYQQVVMYLSDGCHTCSNEIFDSILQEPADETETAWFFENLKAHGFTYNSIQKCITVSEKYYYFPSYSLYNGFQPEKKKWINSDADKFYDQHLEVFDTFTECANWCNVINKALRRDYPEIKLEE